MTWDEEKIKQLKKLWDKGLSTTEIAKKMNVSKNSVVGKVHRLCLKARPSPIKKKDEEYSSEVERQDLFAEQITIDSTQNNAVEELSSHVEIHETEVDDENTEKTTPCANKVSSEINSKSKQDKKTHKHLKLVELDSHTCRWPIGDPRDDDFCFCGKKVHAGQTYCDEHSLVAYVKANSRK